MNLLPHREKKNVRREFLLRAGVVGAFLVFLTGITGIALQMPSYFLSKTKEQSAQEQMTAIQKRAETQQRDEISAELRGAQEKLSVLETEPSESLSAVTRTIVDTQPTGIQLSALSFVRQGEENTGSIRLSGIASNRETLRSYVSTLQSEDVFSQVELPVRDLASDEDIQFSLTITGSF